MSFLRIQREDLPRYLAVSHDEHSNGFRPKAAHGFEAMPAIRGPEASLRCDHCYDRVEKTPGFVDDIREPFVMSIGEISLEGRGFDGIDRQDGQQYRVTGKRFLVRSNNAAAGFLDCRRYLRGSARRLIQPAFGWDQALRPGLCLAGTPPGCWALDHGRDSILVPDGLSLVPDHDHNDSALARTRVRHCLTKAILEVHFGVVRHVMQRTMERFALSEPVLLVLLSLAEQPRHGYSILKDVESTSGGTARDRRTYRLTSRGRRNPQMEIERMRHLTKVAVLRMARKEA